MTLLRKLIVPSTCVLASYIGSYLWLSRTADREGEERYGLEGYFFVLPPDGSDAWWDKEWQYRMFFLPLIYAEDFLGTGESLAPNCFLTLE